MRSGFVIVLGLLVAGPVRAGVYSPEELCPFEVVGGVAKPLSHVRFKSLLNSLRMALNPATPEWDTLDTPDGKKQIPTARGKALARVRELVGKQDRLTPTEQLILSGYLLRTGLLGKELTELKRKVGSRPREYALAANVLHAETLAGNWGDAARVFEDHVLELDRPAQLPGYSLDQLNWTLALDKTHYRKWLRARLADTGRKGKSEDVTEYPLFPGVVFTGEELPPAERAKLPPDAVAIVQQLALWSPTDSGLLWLLAELYAATGSPREAEDAFDMCTWGAGLTGPNRLMAHRKIVRAAVEKLPPPTDDFAAALRPDDAAPADDGVFAVVSPEKLYTFGGVFVLLAVVLIALQIRAWKRRRPRVG